MSVLTAERFSSVKAKVKEEMQRRSAPDQNGSLSQCAGDQWDFEINPETGCVIVNEYIQKLIDPLLQVNDFLRDNSFRSGKGGLEIPLDKIEEFVDKISKIPADASNSGCRGKCTGLCHSGCSGSCQGCRESCLSGCRDGCVHTCGSGCVPGLKY